MRLKVLVIIMGALALAPVPSVYAQSCKPQLRANGTKSSIQKRAENNAVKAWQNIARQKYGRTGTYEWVNASGKRLNCSGRARKQCTAVAKPCPTIRRGANKNVDTPNTKRIRCRGKARLIVDNKISNGLDHCTLGAARIMPPMARTSDFRRQRFQTAFCPRGFYQQAINPGRDVCARR